MNVDNSIPNGWLETTLGKHCLKIGSGSTPRGGNEAYKKEGISLIRSQNILDFDFSYNGLAFIDDEQASKLSNVEIFENDVLINITGDSVARVCIVPKEILPARVNQHVAILRTIKEELNSTFLKYHLLNPIYKRYLLILANSGGTRNALTKSMLEMLQLTLPPFQEQKAIAKILTSFDDKIELLQAQNKTLETTAQTIFKEWFGKYQIDDELPEDWRVGKISEFISESLGGDYGKEEVLNDYTEKTVCLRGTDLPDMKMGVPEKAPRRFLKKSKIERCKLINGDIVIEISGGTENQSTGRVAYINEQILSKSDLPMTCVNFCRILRPIEPENTYFIYSLFEYLYKRKVLFNWENGTTGIKNLNLKALLENFDLNLPNSNEKIVEFNQFVKSSFIKIQENNSQIQTLKKIRDTLLPKLMSGQLRVDEFKETEV